ncbi:hypothetical protein HYE41_02315 [Mycoplasmopsis bovis]|nr:hypothetical protein [Mycoplasmopsis bovis]QQH20684.1 hypothetical protein HYE41_02315 [Mycoplasmopsis bovis]
MKKKRRKLDRMKSKMKLDMIWKWKKLWRWKWMKIVGYEIEINIWWNKSIWR